MRVSLIKILSVTKNAKQLTLTLLFFAKLPPEFTHGFAATVRCAPRCKEWKRTMKAKRLILVVVAVVAGLMAAMMVGNLRQEPQVIVQREEAPEIARTEVLVMSGDVSIGQVLNEDQLKWQIWPEEGDTSRFILRTERPNALSDLAGRIVRQRMFSGEPVQEVKLVSAERGFMSAILPKGKRAVAVEVRAANTAGGFILPNDRVDVLLTRTRGDSNFITETLLENIRILAIDQEAQDPDNQAVMVARDTATLELNPSQAETVTQAQQIGSISLALRSIADSQDDELDESPRRRTGGVNMVRFGIQSKETTRR